MAHRDKSRTGGSALRRFLDDRRGVSAIEFAIIAPVLLLLLLGGTTIFVLVRESRMTERATFTVSDLISRATAVTPSELSTQHALFLAITRHPADDVRFRVTSLKKVEGKKKGESLFEIDWSWAAAPQVRRTDVASIAGTLPLVAVGDSALLVETSLTSKPLFSYLGLSPQTFTFVSANRPRFVGALPLIDDGSDPGSSGGEEDEDDE